MIEFENDRQLTEVTFFKYWHEAYNSEVKIPFELQSHNDLNLFRKGTVTARNTKQWWKSSSATGLKLTTLHFRMANDDPESVLQLSQRPGIVAVHVTIFLSLDLLGTVTILWSSVTLAKT